MQTLADLIELADLCARNARATLNKEPARTLWTMAVEYQQRAAELDNGRLPDIGDRPV